MRVCLFRHSPAGRRRDAEAARWYRRAELETIPGACRSADGSTFRNVAFTLPIWTVIGSRPLDILDSGRSRHDAGGILVHLRQRHEVFTNEAWGPSQRARRGSVQPGPLSLGGESPTSHATDRRRIAC